jgi:serine/threonine protein kinase/tetratricopeptide (TPR) repeat protein
VNYRLIGLDTTCAADDAPRQQLVAVLETYMADLERGVAPDQQSLLDAHPDLADELFPYLESLRLLHGATHDMRVARSDAGGRRGEEAGPAARQIGEYRIVREIGRGGMGIVYEAHQRSLNRQVALKILPFAAVLDQRQIARFRNEAQAAAQLHHPHIVPVFAVGQEQGVYYYAMQYIDGQSLEQTIAELRDERERGAADSTNARGAANGSTTTMQFAAASRSPYRRSPPNGDLFRTVARLGKEAAEALQHAHEHGILHRDIKPSNLLVDGQGKLWITDFGLARMQSDNGVTLTGDLVGTLRYMSPEQAGGSTLVDARTDVYSLGATLYELITLSHAHQGEDRPTLLRHITSDEPVPPRKINPAVPIDLETIVLGAMAKSPNERYMSAQAMVDDLERFLAGKPTLARRPTVVDRIGKWARRHRALVAVAACAVVLLSVVSVVGMVLLAREQAQTSAALANAERSGREARDSLERADRHLREARGAVDHFGIGFSDKLAELPGAEGVRRDLLLDTLAYYRQFAKDAGDDPQLRQETAVAHFKSGAIAAKLGAVTDAIAEYETAQKLLKQLAEADPTRAEPRAQLGVSHNNLGLLFAGRSETDRAQREFGEAIAIQQRLVNERTRDGQFAGELAESQANLGLLLDQLGDSQAAELSLRAAVDVLRPLTDAKPDEPSVVRNLAIALNNLSFVLRSRDAAAAAKSSREAIDILERLAADSPQGGGYQGDLALCYNNLAALESQKGRWAAAIERHRQAIRLQEQMARKSPGVVRHRSDLAISMNNLGVTYCRASKPAEADAAFAQSRDMFIHLADDYPDEVAYRSSLAALLNNQALALAEVGRHRDALEIYPAAIAAQRSCRERVPASEMMRDLLSKMYYNFGRSLRAERRLDEAADAALARRELWQGNGERLLGVAAELAELNSVQRSQPSEAAPIGAQRKLDEDVLATLDESFRGGWPRGIDVGADERFASLMKNERFAAKVWELSARSKGSAAEDTASRTEAN